ncbi:hypothetical protein RHGRI_024155 [Rhododendron griersonianum]|uniref:Aminotransferase-like plant mobile domain-containing protein n=1 Tax=Rhododendron griersonianum TaxID=479676 RepID=A0AAV6J8H9_9ERIC|nr:hypothetical protein RHGRI_024155 [Rhododendron griersonianum]
MTRVPPVPPDRRGVATLAMTREYDDDVEQGSKAILQTSIRALPADEWLRAPYLGGSSDLFWRKAEAFVPETEIPEEPLSLVPEVPHEEADLIPPSSILRFRVERGDVPCCFVNYEAVSQAPAHWGNWVESVLEDPASMHALTASRVLEPVRLSAKLSIRRNNINIDFMVSRWSKDTHTFVFPWGDCGPTLQDMAVMMRLSTRGSVAFDPSNLSLADARLVDRLRRAYTAAGKCGSRFDREGRARAPSKSGFLVYWLSFFVIPDFPYEGPNHTVFPLAVSLARRDIIPLGPLFLGSLFHHLDQVHANTERSLGRYDMVSVVHTQFLMAFCFEHFPSLAPSPVDLSWSEEPCPRITRWSGVSSTKPWGRRIDDVGTFFPRPYAELVEGVLPTNFFSEDDRIVDFQTNGVAVSSSALAAFAAACPCSLPALCAEGTRSVLYRPDRVARQFGYDQGAPGPAPPLKSYAESLRRFTRAHVEELAEGYDIVVLPRNDREAFFTVNGRLAWRRNLNSFINYVRGAPEVPALPDVYHRDVCLRSRKARQTGWRGKRSRWAPPSAALAASRGITIAEPISTVISPRMTRAKAREQSSSQQQGLLLKRLRKGAPIRSSRTSRSEETPASVAFAGSSFKYEGGEHIPLSKLKRKREGEEAREGGSDSSIDDTAPISQSFKLLRTTHLSPGGTSAAAGKKVVITLDEGEPDGDESDANGSDDRDDEEDDDSSAGGSESNQSDEDDDDEDYSGDGNGGEDFVQNEDENLGSGGGNDDDGSDEGRDGGGGDDVNFGGDVMQLVIDEDEEDANILGLVPRRRVLTEGILSVPDINQLAPEADIPPPSSQEAVKTALHLLDKHVNIPPTGDLTSHFQAHDAAVALANLTAAEVFADLQDDSFVSLGLSQTGYAVGDVGDGGSLLASECVSQQQVEASTSREHAAADDDVEVQVVDPPVANEVEDPSNEAFFRYYGFTPESTSFLSFVRDLFPYTFFKVRGLYSRTMGRMQLECLYTFLWSIKDLRWVYKELEAAKIMRGNEKLQMDCEGAKVALEKARAALVEAQSAVTTAEAAVEERRLVYERLAEEARLGDRLVDAPLRNTDPFPDEYLWCLILFTFGFEEGFEGGFEGGFRFAAAAAGGGWAITGGTTGGTTGATGRAAVIASVRAAMAAII